MELTNKTTMGEIYNLPLFAQAKDALISGNGDFFTGENAALSLEALHKKNPTWHPVDILYGLNRLQQLAQARLQTVYSVYSQNEIEANPSLAQVQLLYLPAETKIHNHYAILLAGGAYGAVCTMVEALPVAAKLNAMGITCFCLNYRTATKESFIDGLLPKPLNDLAAAFKYIKRHHTSFGVDASDYIVGGFSAGGHVAALWGTSHLGARSYGLPQPKMLMLAYPLITMENMQDGPLKQMMCTGMFGKDFSPEDLRQYDASRHVDAQYPKVYLASSTDDTTVSRKDADDLIHALNTADVANRLERAQSGGHGFGLGSTTPLNGWVERAVAFHEGR